MLMSISQQSFSQCVLLVFFSSPKSSLRKVLSSLSQGLSRTVFSTLSFHSHSPSPTSEYPATTWGYSTRSSSISLFLRSPLEQNRFASEKEGSSLISLLHSPSYSLSLSLSIPSPATLCPLRSLSLSLSWCWLKYYYYYDLKGIMIFFFCRREWNVQEMKKVTNRSNRQRRTSSKQKISKEWKKWKRGALLCQPHVWDVHQHLVKMRL